jgi:exodeoxyribonuclease VII small subunit
VAQIEEGSIGIDELSAKVKKAAELIKICKTKLHATEEDVQQILKDLESNKNQ